MKPVAEGERVVVNINEADFEPYSSTDRGEFDGSVYSSIAVKPLGVLDFTSIKWNLAIPPFPTSTMG